MVPSSILQVSRGTSISGPDTEAPIRNFPNSQDYAVLQKKKKKVAMLYFKS